MGGPSYYNPNKQTTEKKHGLYETDVNHKLPFIW